MKTEIYEDGLSQIHFTGNMIRFDFMTLQPGKDGAPVSPQKSERIIMPVTGFLRTLDMMRKMADKLVDDGILQKNTPVPAAKKKSSGEAAPRKSRTPRKKI